MKVAVLGSLTRDYIVISNRNERYTQAGGGAYYSSSALASLGVDVCCFPLLSQKDKELLVELEHPKIKIIPQWTAETTVYRNIYHTNSLDDCNKEILSRARDYKIDKETLEVIRACDAVHLVPLSSDEFSINTYHELRKRYNKLVGLDGQGFTKFQIDNLGSALTGNIDILKLDDMEILQITSSKEELAAVDKLKSWGVSEILVTKASQGSVIYVGKDSYVILPAPALKIVDTTGCGDAYMAGYLVGRLSKHSPEKSALFASKVAAKNLEFRGAIKVDLSSWVKNI